MKKEQIFEQKYKGLNERQKEAVDTIYGPLMVVAGPGTGKTTLLTLRIANILLKTDAKPEEILALTFTESGVRSMREKLREIIGDISFRVNIFTFHGFANHIKSLYPENFEKIGERLPCSEVEKLEIIEGILSKHNFELLRVSDFGASLKKISSRISDLKREIISPDDLRLSVKEERKKIIIEKKSLEKINKTKEKDIEKREKHLNRIEELALLYELYEKELHKKSLYDFDDSILELINALKENSDMAEDMRENYQFILADEHQDANGAQNGILKIFKGDVDMPNVMVVGDDKQSIFHFQGASLEHFYNFSNEFKGAKKITLENNYRSHRIILDASHSLISSDGGKHQKLISLPHKEEKNIDVIEFSKYEDELIGISKRIKDIISNNKEEKIAVITRNNRALFDLAPFLDIEKIDYVIDGEKSLFSNFEYRKLFYLLDGIANPFEGRLLKALYSGFFGINIADIVFIANYAKDKRLDFSSVFLGNYTDDLKKGLIDFELILVAKEKINDLIKLSKKTPISEFIKILKNDIYHNLSPKEYEPLKVLFDESQKLVLKKRDSILDDLVSHLKFIEKHDLSQLSIPHKRETPLELMSIHRAKGLEYDYVFIIDVIEKRFEGSGKRGDLLAIPGIGSKNEMEEERRLLYVAITRAKKHVTISFSLSGEKGENNRPSVLLDEIDTKFVNRIVSKDSYARPDILSLSNEGDYKKDLRDYFLARSFSVTALNNFIECPYKYLFKNLLLLPDIKEYSANLGNASHSTLREFHLLVKKGKEPNLKEIKKIISNSVSRESFSENEIDLANKKINESVIAYQKTFKPFKDESVFIEQSFSFVHKIKSGDKNFDINITGKIDLARGKEDDLTVIDFKTKKKMTRNGIIGETKNGSGNEMRQLQFYKFLVENSANDFSVNRGILTFLTPDRGNIHSEVFDLTDKDKEYINNLLNKTLLSIFNFDFIGKGCNEKDCEYCNLSKYLGY